VFKLAIADFMPLRQFSFNDSAMSELPLDEGDVRSLYFFSRVLSKYLFISRMYGDKRFIVFTEA
jgi:hypothetical protein